MKKSKIQHTVGKMNKLTEGKNGTLKGGFISLTTGYVGQNLSSYTNDNSCNNTGDCTKATNQINCTNSGTCLTDRIMSPGTNDNSCNNTGDCTKATNQLNCTNSGTCFFD